MSRVASRRVASFSSVGFYLRETPLRCMLLALPRFYSKSIPFKIQTSL